ncbi:RNA-binding domain-containing protein [Kaistella sp.]|uniref:RNA-binding domain-containing protein n=1 Tax=Kaistella sp. TaxID=2782235 RepID=UPI003C4F84E6
MSLPINIHTLVHGDAIEWERLEFKRGWNPEEVAHTICAFANDINNWGGGYIIVGIDEQDGSPILPPFGLPQNRLDRIQGEIVNLANQLQPHYFPIVQPYLFQDKHILILWCPAGDNRPYTALSTQGKGAQRYSYVRHGSRSVIARDADARRLIELTARIPFDDRINQQADINDFDLGLIQAFLQEVKSDLFEESKQISMANLARNMLIAKGPNENLLPVNVGLLFFSKNPEKFFPRTWIELVVHRDDSGSNFTEHYFKGSLPTQLRDALSFLQTNVIKEHVKKVPYQAEALRFYNIPYDAVEEALSNAVYHKSYEIRSPIEIQVWQDKIEIVSYPGPIPPVDAQILQSQERIVARDYRNRRIGDFLKELDLTEGRGTGLPTIYKAMERNGSPKPILNTDTQSTCFLVTLLVHPLVEIKSVMNKEIPSSISNLDDVIALVDSINDGVSDGVIDGVNAIVENEVHHRAIDMLKQMKEWISREQMFAAIGLANSSTNRKRYLDPLLDLNWVAMKYPDIPTHPRQQYKRTHLGENILKIIGI